MDNNKRECTILWCIENYSYCWQKNGEILVSPVFATKELQGTSWTLCLYPRGQSDEGKGRVFIYLNRNKDDGPKLLKVEYHLSIVAEDGSTDFSEKYTSDFSVGSRWGWSFVDMDKILSQRKEEYLPKDILTVRCHLSISEENTDQAATIYGHTRIGIEYIFFHHSVESFSTLEPNQMKTYQIHSYSQLGHVKSCIYIKDDPCCEEKLMVEIKPSRRYKILAKCELSLLEASGRKTKCAEADNRFDVNPKNIQKLPLSITKDAIINKRSQYLLNDKLSLLCECTFSTGIEFQRIEGIHNEIATTEEKLAIDSSHLKYTNIAREKLTACPNALDDLKKIFTSKIFSDVELKTKTNSFPAHKLVLCARSPVFKVMMSHDMKEKNSNSIQVEDLEDDTVQQLLLFIYSDHLGDLQWETATKLYYASDKYQIEKLRLTCSSFFIENLNVSTSAKLLLLADNHNDLDLKKVAEDFILDNDEQVFSSNEWEELVETNPQLALKTMQLRYKKKEGK